MSRSWRDRLQNSLARELATLNRAEIPLKVPQMHLFFGADGVRATTCTFRAVIRTPNTCCLSAENVAQQWNVSREEQDRFSSESQLKATAAIQAGHFKKEIVAVSVPAAKKGAAPIEVDQDEFPKPDTTPEKLAKLRPAFLPVSSDQL